MERMRSGRLTMPPRRRWLAGALLLACTIAGPTGVGVAHGADICGELDGALWYLDFAEGSGMMDAEEAEYYRAAVMEDWWNNGCWLHNCN